MARRQTSERRQSILDALHLHGRVQVDSLARSLNTSEVTIRKDLSALEQDGHLIRRYGGAISASNTAVDHTLTVVSPSPPLEVSVRKKEIGRYAAQQVKNHSRILIDFGTTTTAMIPHLNTREGLVVMTNSMRTAQEILSLEPAPTLLMTGGTWDTQTQSLQGQIAEQVLRSYDFDQLFIGCDGIDPTRGTTTFNELTGLSKVMAESASEVIVVATTDKVGRRIPNLELPWSKINKLIIDVSLPIDARRNIEQQGVEIIIATPDGEK